MRYKGYEIEITDSQGNGSFESPLTNTPYGYDIKRDGFLIYQRVKSNSDRGCAIADAKQSVNHCIERSRI